MDAAKTEKPWSPKSAQQVQNFRNCKVESNQNVQPNTKKNVEPKRSQILEMCRAQCLRDLLNMLKMKYNELYNQLSNQ